MSARANQSRKRSAARQALDLLGGAVNHSALFRLDPVGRISSWNARAKELTGYGQREVMGCKLARIGLSSLSARTLRARHPVEIQGRCKRKNDGSFSSRVVCAPIHDGLHCSGFDVLLQDLDRISEAEQDRKRLAAIVEDSDDAIFVLSLNGRIQSWNRAAEQLFGYKRSEIVGKPITMLIPPEIRRAEGDVLRRRRRGEKIDHYESVRLRKDGKRLNVSISISPMRDSSGKVVAASKIVRNITDRRTAEKAVHESERRMRSVVETAVDAIITIDERGTIESANPAAERSFGYSQKELLGRNVKMLMPDPYQGEHDQYLKNYLRTGKAKIIGLGREVVAMRKDGSTFPISLAVSEVPLGDKRLFTGIVHDLSARRSLQQQIIEASTAEQRRIAQDLHDGLCQELIAIALRADRIARQMSGAPLSATDLVNQIAASVREVAGQARQLSHGLNPIDLSAGGLSTALEGLANRVSESFATTCRFHWDGVAAVRDATIATQLFRIAQESINNAIRHGKAKRIDIRLSSARKFLKLSIADNGKGFSPPVIKLKAPHTADEAAAKSSSGIGLATMRYRANTIGGVFDIRPRPSGGTVVTVAMRASPKPTDA